MRAAALSHLKKRTAIRTRLPAAFPSLYCKSSGYCYSNSIICLFACQAKCDINVVENTTDGVKQCMSAEANPKMAANEAIQALREAWDKGIAIGQVNNAERVMLRIVVANRIKALRVERGISQEKFSEKVNVAFLTYKGYENRKSDIPTHVLVRVANELNTSIDYLTGRTDTKEASSVEERLRKLEEALKAKSGE